MADATERLVNLALYLAESREPVTAGRVREEVEGYASDQDEDAFLRMFERDKKELRASGFVLRAVELPSGTAYELDRGATFQNPVDLSAQDRAVLRTVGAAFVEDVSFPYREALVGALAKLAAPASRTPSGSLADEAPERQGTIAADLARACVNRKSATFAYRDAQGRDSARTVEPYGLFLRDGRWYLVARDRDAEDLRVFALRRIDDLSVETKRPGTPDFERPDDFDATDFARLPFQFGETEFEAVLEFDEEVAWRAPVLTEGRGTLEDLGGPARWTVPASDADRLARWVVDSGPGIAIVSPPHAVNALRAGLEAVIGAHG